VLQKLAYKDDSFGQRFLKLILNNEEFLDSDEYEKLSLAENEVIEAWIDSIPESYSTYEGFDSIEACLETLLLPKSKYVFIHFQGQYYAVAYESGTRQIIVGKDQFIYTNDTRLLYDEEHPSNYPIRQRVKYIGEPKTILCEMLAIDPDMKAYIYKQEKSTKIYEADEGYEHSFAQLGSTFKDYDFTKHNVGLLHFYYTNLEVEFFEYYLEYYDFISINPFRWNGKEYNEETQSYEIKRLPAPYSAYCRRWIGAND